MVTPSFTVGRLRRPAPRLVAIALGAILVGAALVPLAWPQPSASAPALSLAAALPPSTWAFAIPHAWLVAPITGLSPGDRIDVLALRASDRATASAIAFDLEVMSVDERALVVAVDANGATALAVARASGLLLVPLLRSER
ncbi:MAG: hypothetical protein ACRDF0_02115 [Candidatus Limnocylindria bacterium]